MILMEFSMTPLDKGESVSPYVARCVEIVANSGLDYRLHAMGTIVEGNTDQVLGVLKACLDDLSRDCRRITCSVKLDYRQGQKGRLVSKVASVESKLGKNLKTTETDSP